MEHDSCFPPQSHVPAHEHGSALCSRPEHATTGECGARDHALVQPFSLSDTADGGCLTLPCTLTLTRFRGRFRGNVFVVVQIAGNLHLRGRGYGLSSACAYFPTTENSAGLRVTVNPVLSDITYRAWEEVRAPELFVRIEVLRLCGSQEWLTPARVAYLDELRASMDAVSP